MNLIDGYIEMNKLQAVSTTDGSKTDSNRADQPVRLKSIATGTMQEVTITHEQKAIQKVAVLEAMKRTG